MAELDDLWMTAISDISVSRAVPMTLRDGVTLYADLYYPPGSGPFPVLLMRQPYGREIASTVVYAQPEWFARQGFLVVIQDVRGRGDSEGEFYAFAHEAADGQETLAWAANLEGANGRVGMYGFSYQGYTQTAALLGNPPELVAIAPHMAASDLYEGWFYRCGQLQLATTLSWGNQMLREDAWRRGATESAEALEHSWAQPGSLNRSLPVREVDPLTRDDLPNYVADWLAHGARDAFWENLDTSAALATAEIPVFHLSGYYDFYHRGAMQQWRARENRDQDFLLLGPWRHIPWEDRIGPLDFGPASRLDTDQILADFFKAHLVGEGQAPRGVRYFLLGDNRWQEDTNWPPTATRKGRFALASKGKANSRFGDGALVIAEPSGPPDVFVYDPEVPVLAPGGASAAWGPSDLAPAQQGNNLLCYTTAPLEARLVFAGAPRLRLSMASTAPETALVARLSLVNDSRQAIFLTLAAAEVQFSGEEDIQEVELVFDDIAVALSKGQALRLDLASSAFPLLARHPNTDTSPLAIENPSQFRRARQTIFHDENHPAHLHLPVMDI